MGELAFVEVREGDVDGFVAEGAVVGEGGIACGEDGGGGGGEPGAADPEDFFPAGVYRG